MKSVRKKVVAGTPLEPVARAAAGGKPAVRFTTSAAYWDNRYKNGGTSGSGSYGQLAAFKAEVLNGFVVQHGIESVIEFGSGDGNQLKLAEYPAYTGVDVSPTAVEACRALFDGDASKSFVTVAEYGGQTADLSLSLDVIFHLIEDAVFETYMATLFDAAERYVIVYASNKDEETTDSHVRHRRFTDWIERNRPGFRLSEQVPNRYPFDPEDPIKTSFADFYVFERNAG